MSLSSKPIAALLPLLAACAAGPDYAPPQPPSAAALEAGAFLRADAVEAAKPAARWWEAIGDPELSRLIDAGLRQAPAIEAAQARVRQARAGLAGARAALLPALNASALYVRADLPEESLGGSSGSIDLFNVGFDTQWEADLWGAKRRSVEKSRAQADAAAARLADAQVSLSAEIARSYVVLRARQANLALLDRRHELESRLAVIARHRFEGGTAPRQPVEAALQQLARTEAEQATMAAEITALRDSLAVLTGSAPGALDALPEGAVPLPPATVAVGDPTALLARRPDIRSAERQLAAANAQIGIEEARRFPQISLLGLIGIGGSSAGDLFDASQLSTIAVPRLSWSFLDFGRTAAAVRGAEAGRDAALAEYRASVLTALQDAETALARYGAARTVLAKSGQQAKHAEASAALQQQRASGGTLAPSEAIEAQRRAIDARLAETHDRAALTLAYVALAKSLGLGWGETRD